MFKIMIKILTVPKVYETTVLDRPSKSIKSPYLADIVDPITKETVLAHTPALGCCGLIVSGSKVIVVAKNTKAKSKYSIDFVVDEKKYLIGVNPMYANTLVRNMIELKLIRGLTKLDSLKAEYKYECCRFDFFGTINTEKVYIEVKNVPLADYCDCNKKEKKKMDLSKYKYNEKIAIFPDGYRKNQNEPVSPRALKHLQNMIKLVKNNKCYMIYIVQRRDITSFTPTVLDQIYRKAFIEAMNSGVIIKVYKIIWKKNIAYFGGEIPISLGDSNFIG